jgi:AcrR family transcriptional regulator
VVDLTPSQSARRERIIDAAFEFMIHHEYDEIQMREVADRASVALGTLYRYFTSKEHLFGAVLVKWGQMLQGRVERTPLRSDDAGAQIAEIYRRAIDAFGRRPQFYRLVIVIENSADPHARELWAEFSAVSTGTLSGPLEALEPGRAEAISFTLGAVTDDALRGWVNGRWPIDVARERVQRTIDLIFAPPPGRVQAGA